MEIILGLKVPLNAVPLSGLLLVTTSDGKMEKRSFKIFGFKMRISIVQEFLQMYFK